MNELTHTSSGRPLSGIDRLLSRLDKQLRQLAGRTAAPREVVARPSPAAGHDEPALSPSEREHASGLMRVNHTGEETREKLLVAAQEEADHLAWCEARLAELDAEPSRLNALFYTASFMLGAATAMAGDKVSLGFVHATEERVANHLRSHLKALPGEDRKSQLILQQMLNDEERHGAEALEHGGQEFPRPLKDLMTLASQLMTRTTYWI